jgi:hypothetical protein
MAGAGLAQDRRGRLPASPPHNITKNFCDFSRCVAFSHGKQKREVAMTQDIMPRPMAIVLASSLVLGLMGWVAITIEFLK